VRVTFSRGKKGAPLTIQFSFYLGERGKKRKKGGEAAARHPGEEEGYPITFFFRLWVKGKRRSSPGTR